MAEEILDKSQEQIVEEGRPTPPSFPEHLKPVVDQLRTQALRVMNEDLPRAEQNLKFAETEVIRIQGAITGLNIALQRILEAEGVQPETFMDYQRECATGTCPLPTR